MTLVELLAVVAVMGSALVAFALYLQPMEAPLDEATNRLEGLFRVARVRGLATTSAYRVSPDGAGGLRGDYANNCTSATWTRDRALDLELPDEVTLTDTTWAVCFSSRGLASVNTVITMTHPRFGDRQVEVLLGGATRVL